MSKSRLLIVSILLTISVSVVMAKPTVSSESYKPLPVGGISALRQNTIYPSWAQDARMSSTVLLNFDVDAMGNVSNIRVARSGGDMFDESAINAVKNTSWTPARQSGTAVAVKYEQPFEFISR